MTLAPPAPQERTTRVRSLSRGWQVAAVIILIPVLVPPLSLLWQVIEGGTGIILPADRLLELFANTLLLAAAVTVTALAIGTATAWITSRTDIRFRRGWMILAALPLVIPSYVAALTIIGATGPGGLLADTLGWDLPTPFGFVGAWVALAIFLAPMAHLIVTPALQQVDPATEEAAIGLGSSRLRAFFTVTLPQLRPAMASAGLMVALYTISDFGAVSLLRFDTFTRAIFTLYQGQIDRRPAGTLSAILMALAIVVLVVERRTRGRASYHKAKPTRRRQVTDLAKWQRRFATGFMGLFALLSLVLPVSVLTYWLTRGMGAGQELPSIWPEIGRSLSVAVVAAVVAAAVSIPVAMVAARQRSGLGGIGESIAWGTYALPHITVGVAMVGFALAWAQPLYQTVLLLVATYVIMFLAQAVSSTQDSIKRFNPVLEDASRGLGHGQISTLFRVTVPLIAPGLLAGGALVFIGVIKELPATLLLRPNEFETLAIRIWSATGEGFLTRASLSSLALIAVSIIPLFLVTTRDLSD
ncbi:MAG: iron ABC transporter permease [Actinobacteria bacterium]|nr:MAG: iron ABC transporter permease [Actinomycetota bacterium]